MHILILANSYKEGGRCLAGLSMRDLTRWIRPTDPATEHGQVPNERCVVDRDGHRGDLRILDVVDLSLGDPTPLPHQPENVALTSGGITFLRSADRGKSLPILRGSARVSGAILELKDTKAVSCTVAAEGLEASLELVLVVGPRFYMSARSRNQMRASFTLDDRRYDLPVTDPAMLERPPPDGSRGEWLFVVSLSEPFQDKHWLLIAGCISLS